MTDPVVSTDDPGDVAYLKLKGARLMDQEERDALRAKAVERQSMLDRPSTYRIDRYYGLSADLAAAVPALLDELAAAEDWALQWQQKCLELDAELAAKDAAIESGEAARVWVGAHFHELKGAIADALTSVKIPAERAHQLATLVMASMSHVYPDAPWQGEINDTLAEFGRASVLDSEETQ